MLHTGQSRILSLWLTYIIESLLNRFSFHISQVFCSLKPVCSYQFPSLSLNIRRGLCGFLAWVLRVWPCIHFLSHITGTIHDTHPCFYILGTGHALNIFITGQRMKKLQVELDCKDWKLFLINLPCRIGFETCEGEWEVYAFCTWNFLWNKVKLLSL